MGGHANNSTSKEVVIRGSLDDGVRLRSDHDLSLERVHGLRQMSEQVRCASAVWPTPGLRARARDIHEKGVAMPATETSPAVQGGRPHRSRVRPQGDRPGRTRDARPDGHAIRVRREPAARRRSDHRIAPHDGADGRAHRDPDRARSPGALGELQHLLHPGSRCRRGGGRSRRHRRGPQGDPRLRLEGRDARGVLVVHRAGAAVAGRGRPEPHPRRRRGRHPAGPQGRRVREGRRGSRSLNRRFRGVPVRPGPPGPQPRRRTRSVGPPSPTAFSV